MNCKQGDLVRYVGNHRKNSYGWIGRITQRKDSDEGVAWIVDPPLNGGVIVDHCGVQRADFWVLDEALQPIRGTEGKDETLTWAPVPDGVLA